MHVDDVDITACLLHTESGGSHDFEKVFARFSIYSLFQAQR